MWLHVLVSICPFVDTKYKILNEMFIERYTPRF